VYTDISHAIATFLFALHLSILTVWPVIYTVGIDFLTDSRTSSHYRMIRIFSEFRYVVVAFLAEISCTTPLERAILYPVIGAVAGALLGSLASPLDWERPWQVRNDRKIQLNSSRFHYLPLLVQSLGIPQEEQFAGCIVQWIFYWQTQLLLTSNVGNRPSYKCIRLRFILRLFSLSLIVAIPFRPCSFP